MSTLSLHDALPICPGLALSGFYESFAFQRVQVFGRGEVAYLKKLIVEKNFETIKQLFSYHIPCCVFTHSLEIPEEFSSIAEEAGCPVLSTDLESTEFSSRLLRVFSNIFAQKQTIHGVLPTFDKKSREKPYNYIQCCHWGND